MKKTYVITGSTSGIGKVLLSKLACENTVFAGYRNEKYKEDLLEIGAIPFYIDMEKTQSISDAANFIKSKTEYVDTLVNAAGCVIAGIIETLSTEKIKKQFDINTFGHLKFTQELLPNVKRIINISSMASFGIFPFVSPYCASKRALDILFNAMTLESDLEVISIKPGVIATPLWQKSIELNYDSIENCAGYEKQMKYLVGNAERNGHRGLKAEQVADFIIKIDSLKNPKPSYTIGMDAKVAEIFAKLPFSLQNKIIKLGMKLRIK